MNIFSLILVLCCVILGSKCILQGPSSNLSSIVAYKSDMSDDGSILILATQTMDIKLYSVGADGQITLLFTKSGFGIYSYIDVSPDGTFAALAENNTVEICNITANSLVSFQNISLTLSESVESASFSPTNLYLTLSELSGKAMIYKLIGTYSLFDTVVETQKLIVAMMPINLYFATGGDEKILRIYKINNSGVTLIQSISNNNKVITNIKISSDESQILVLSNNFLRIYSGGNGSYSFSQEITLQETFATDVIACNTNDILMTCGNGNNLIEVYTVQSSGYFAINETKNIGSGV